jgi:hypothetical protein
MSLFDHADKVAETLGITRMTSLNWTQRQVVPEPIKVNKRLYYSRTALEVRLLQTQLTK